MRTRAVCILICMLGALVSCNSSHHYPSLLTTVDSLCEIRPDSAQALLQTLANDTATMREDARMYYKLLTIRTADKLYQPHTSDSLIRQIVNYYEHGGDPKLLPIAYYYAGSVYRDLNDAPQALDYFQKAVDTTKDSIFNDRKMAAYSQAGGLFLKQRMYDEALDMFHKAYHSSLLLNDSLKTVHALRFIGTTYRFKLESDSAKFYYEKALHIAERYNDSRILGSLYIQMAAYYNQVKDYKQAKEYLNKARKHDITVERRTFWGVAAETFRGLEIIDSALYYNYKLVGENHLVARSDGYSNLTDIFIDQKDYPKAAKYIKEYRLYSDSVNEYAGREAVAQMNALYNYQLREKENHELNTRINREKRNKNILLLCLLIGAIVSYMYTNTIRLRNMSMKLKLEKYETHFAQSKKQQDDSRNRHDIILEKEPAVIRFKDLANGSAIIKMDTIKEADWINLRDVISKKYPTFEKELCQLCKMSERDFHICLLLKAGFQSSDISKLLRITNNNLYSACRKLFKRSFGIEKSYNEWKNVIERI